MCSPLFSPMALVACLKLLVSWPTSELTCSRCRLHPGVSACLSPLLSIMAFSGATCPCSSSLCAAPSTRPAQGQMYTGTDTQHSILCGTGEVLCADPRVSGKVRPLCLQENRLISALSLLSILRPPPRATLPTPSL